MLTAPFACTDDEDPSERFELILQLGEPLHTQHAQHAALATFDTLPVHALPPTHTLLVMTPMHARPSSSSIFIRVHPCAEA